MKNMKKIFLFASAVVLSATSLDARVYVQTGKEGDPAWDKSVIGEDANVVTFTSVADLPVTGEKEIWFAAGTYVFDATFEITQYDAVLAGGFKGTETTLEEREKVLGGNAWDFVNETVLDGNGAVKLIADTKRTSFDGLTMQGSSSSASAGICRLASTADKISYVRGCKCLNNAAANQGGCFQMYNANSVLIEDSYFEGNSAKQGGAIYNHSTSGELTIRNCYFKGNTAFIENNNAGGAVHTQNAAAAVIIGNTFEANKETGGSQGAALSMNGTNAASLVANNLFVDNIASDEENGRRCVVLMATGNFYYNTVVESTGSAIWQKAGNCKNNVFYATTEEKARISFEEPVVFTNNAGVNAWKEGADATNIVISLNNKPVEGDEEGLYAYFANPENHDFALQAGSALANAGVAVEDITTDITGQMRTKADIGAYAYDETSTAVENTNKPLDIQAALSAGEVYNVLGQRVGELQAGNIYIVGGQKVIIR